MRLVAAKGESKEDCAPEGGKIQGREKVLDREDKRHLFVTSLAFAKDLSLIDRPSFSISLSVCGTSTSFITLDGSV